MSKRGGLRQVHFPVLCGLLLAWVISGAAQAQEPGNVTGVVTDDEGIPLAGAFVLIDGTSIAAITDPDGSYAVTGIPPGDRQLLVVTYVSYRTVRREISVVGGETVTEHVTLLVDLLDLERVVVTGTSNPQGQARVERGDHHAEQRGDRSRTPPLSTTELLSRVPGFWAESSGGRDRGQPVHARPAPGRQLPLRGDVRGRIAGLRVARAIFRQHRHLLSRGRDGGRARGGARRQRRHLRQQLARRDWSTSSARPAERRRRARSASRRASYGLFRGDFNYGGPIGEDWRFNVGGFYRFDSGVRDPDFLADQGGQIRLNATRIFDGGYVRFYFKALDEKNIFYLPIPLRDADNPKSIPGVNAQFGTMTSLDAAAVRVPTGDGLVRSMNLRDGVNPRVLSFGIEFFHDLDNGWSLKNNARLHRHRPQLQRGLLRRRPRRPPGTSRRRQAAGVQRSAASGRRPPTAARYSFATSGEHDRRPRHDERQRPGSRVRLVERAEADEQLHQRSAADSRGFETHDLTLGLYFSTYRADDFWQFNDMLLEARNAPRLLNLDFLDAPGGNVVGSATQNGFTRYGTRYVRAEQQRPGRRLLRQRRVGRSTTAGVWTPGCATSTRSYDGNTEVTAQYRTSAARILDFRSFVSVEPASFIPTLADRDLQWGTGRVPALQLEFRRLGRLGRRQLRCERPARRFRQRISSGFRQPTFDRWSVLAPGSTHDQRGRLGDRPPGRGRRQDVDPEPGPVRVRVFYSRLDNVIFNDEVLDSGGNLVPRQRRGQHRDARSRTGGGLPAEPAVAAGRDADPAAGRVQGVRSSRPAAGSPLDFSGNRVRRIPDRDPQFQAHLPDRPSQDLSRTGPHVGERYSDDANTVELPAYDTIDLGVIYVAAADQLRAAGQQLVQRDRPDRRQPALGPGGRKSLSDVYLARPILGRAARFSVAYSVLALPVGAGLPIRDTGRSELVVAVEDPAQAAQDRSLAA